MISIYISGICNNFVAKRSLVTRLHCYKANNVNKILRLLLILVESSNSDNIYL